jgi:multiple sugar transport system permease protein
VTTLQEAPTRASKPPRVRSRRPGGSAIRRSERNAGLILVGPALLFFTVFMFVPLVLTFWYSLHRYSGFGRMRFIGVQNYRNIVVDDTFWKALLNTVLYTAVTVPIGIALGLGAALLLNRVMPARALFRALVYVPVVISGVAAGIIFLRLFDPLTGIINQLATSLGLPTVDWQGNGTAALVSVIVTTLWQGVGFGMVVYLSGLQAIPGELYEAGSVDRAVGWRRFVYITWPLLRPTTFFMVIYSIIGSFQVFDVVYVLTRGGPGTATTFLVQYAYDQGFNQRRQGYAAAIGAIIYVIMLAFTAVQWRVQRGGEDT